MTLKNHPLFPLSAMVVPLESSERLTARVPATSGAWGEYSLGSVVCAVELTCQGPFTGGTSEKGAVLAV